MPPVPSSFFVYFAYVAIVLPLKKPEQQPLLVAGSANYSYHHKRCLHYYYIDHSCTIVQESDVGVINVV